MAKPDGSDIRVAIRGRTPTPNRVLQVGPGDLIRIAFAEHLRNMDKGREAVLALRQLEDRDIAMVFQNYALYPHMSVYKNMAFGLTLRRFPKVEIDQRVREAARVLGIERLLDRKPKALSGGERQRVAVGRAIVRQPQAFLFDEPLSNLDAKLRVEMRAELKRLHRRLRTTVLYVTHDQAEAMTLGDRVAVMNAGCIQQVAPPLEVYDHPADRRLTPPFGPSSAAWPWRTLSGGRHASSAGVMASVRG